MKRPKAHDVNEQAKRIFQSSLPPDWVAREENPDYGLDYVVEIFEQEQTTGLRFGVQLKGTTKLRQGSGHVKISLPTENLADYIDKSQQPVFVVVIDVPKKTGYWVFIQEFAREKLNKKTWREKKTVTIHIPESNMLCHIELLHAALTKAYEYMKALYPGSVPNAIKADRQRLENLDPRFSINIEATEHSIRYTVNAKEPVPITFNFKGPPADLSEKMDSLLERGLPTVFSSNEVEIDGSPLFEHMTKKDFTIQFARRVEPAVSLAAVDSFGKDIGRLEVPTGKLEGGPGECRFEGCTPGHVFRLKVTIPLEFGRPRSTVKIRHWIDLNQWWEKPVRQLAYFQDIYSVFDGISRGAGMRLVLSSLGNRLCAGVVHPEQLTHFSTTALS